jgi:hypothetical protein
VKSKAGWLLDQFVCALLRWIPEPGCVPGCSPTVLCAALCGALCAWLLVLVSVWRALCTVECVEPTAACAAALLLCSLCVREQTDLPKGTHVSKKTIDLAEKLQRMLEGE